MSSTPLHSVSVAGVTFDGAGRVLVIKRRDNAEWQAPGGVLELDETFEDGVIREVFEETGVNVSVERLTGVYKNLNLAVVALVYRCTAVSGQPRTTDESIDVAWLDVEHAVRFMKPAFAVRVTDALECNDGLPASRAHDGENLIGL